MYDNRSAECATDPPASSMPADGCRAALTLGLFGGLQIRLEGDDVADRLPGRQGRMLVAYLLLNQDRPVSRDELLDVLWPSRPPAAPEAALSSVLAKVRRSLGRDVIKGRQALVLQLEPDDRLDLKVVGEEIACAERALAERDPAIALQAGQTVLEILSVPLLPDLDGEWIQTWRRHFDELAARALEIVANAALGLGDRHLPTAERAAATLVARDAFREGAYALLMQAQAQQGNVAQALRTFEQVRVLLREELGTGPSGSLVALHERLLREELPAAPAPQQPPAVTPWPTVTAQMIEGAFVGREEFLQRLWRRWQESRSSQTRLVLLVGEAGVGKTRLAAEFSEQVHDAGGMVLYGRADADALLPHQPFVEALRNLLTHGDAGLAAAADQDREILWRLLPDLAPRGHVFESTAHEVDDQTLRYRLFEAVTGLLCAASRRAPLLLVLDDLHWADKPTLLLLRHVLRHPRVTDVLIVGTFRHVEVGIDHPLVDLLTDLRRERRYDRLTIPGLDDCATGALVADRLGRPATAQFVRRLRQQTEGNAFFIEETIRALEESGLGDEPTVSAAALERLGVPEGVSEIVGRRVSHLSSLACEVLTAAAVVGRDFCLGIVAQIVREPPERVMGVLEESMAAGLVHEVADRIDMFGFTHALVREVLYSRLSVSRRVRLHHAVAEALEKVAECEAVNPAELAHHFLLARHFTGPAPARRYAIAAGERATELLAYEEAVEHYSQAARLFEDDDEAARCEVLLALGRAQWRAGSDAARLTFRTAADSAALRGDADQLARAALGHSARYYESGYAGARDSELLEEALAALGGDDSARRVFLLSRLAGNVAFATDERERAADLIGEALAMARRLGDEDVLLAALMARHATLLDVWHLEERLSVSEELMGLRIGHPELLAERHHWRLYDLLECGDLDAALMEQPRLEALAKRLRQPQWHSIAVGWRGIWAELAGDVDEAERCAEECLQCGQRAHMKDALGIWAAKLIMLRRRQGRAAELVPVIEQLVRGADTRKTGWRSALGLILAETGDENAARAIYREQLPVYREAIPSFWLTNITMLSELCAALRDAEGARTLYAELAPFAHRNVVVSYASCWGPVERYLGLLAATYGDEERAGSHARNALRRTQAMSAALTAGSHECDGDVRAA